MTIITTIFTVLASLLHIFIFYLESFAWTTRARSVFGTTEESAAQTKEMAFNQGFYNLFLALIALAGVVFSHPALIVAGLGSMLGAALVLFITSPDKRSAASKQGIFPLLGLIFLLIG
ncbi:hypothetical membrane protein [Corynebacterium kutscheri]|uniref:Hypothetical membrane protein n=1 Tax=Corynebacterium kutscheri TaxID=35755 RepID=A0A0F6TCR1_9CORY|nr:DUF1304 domain-containing protein [Corynebacterium kutscheri]AKE40299.1 putative membrane protein [Corynebacterium kutscheri]VEH05488.1 hypothetical membrane protein [Corynebacterium kutscheri]VEH10691.1 hypothetical membrane protein [Corynebacterium kutscheri]VEH81379.1 hypothetical membrane protein [Corynebacterium kutscheri]